MNSEHFAALLPVLALACGSTVEQGTPDEHGSTSAAGGTGGAALTEECTMLATPLTSLNALAAARCEGLLAQRDSIVGLQPDQNGTLDSDGVAAAWRFLVRRASTGAVGVGLFDSGGVLYADVGDTSLGDCTLEDGISILDSSQVIPDALARLPQRAAFENAFLNQNAACLSTVAEGDEHWVTIYHSPNAVSYFYYNGQGSFVTACGPCEKGTSKSSCVPCQQ